MTAPTRGGSPAAPAATPPGTVCRVSRIPANRSFVRRRSLLRVATMSLSVPLVAVLASPALAYSRDDGDQPGPGLSVLQTLGLFVGIPLAAFLIIAVMVYAPSSARGPRYRPNVGWWAAPVWFNGPGQTSAPTVAESGSGSEAGAFTEDEEHAGAARTLAGGGTSARW